MRILVLLVTGLFYFMLGAQEPSSQLLIKEKVYDFGQILEKNGPVSHTFTFTNTGKQPIIINGTYSGCGCTSSDFTKLPIKPGAKGTITVRYNPANRPGVFSKELVVFFNGKKNYTRIWVKGTVVPKIRPVEEDHPYKLGQGLYSSLKVLAFGSVAKGQSKEITLFYANDSGKEMQLVFQTEGKHPQLSFANPQKLQAHKRGKIIFTYTETSPNQHGRTFRIFLYINGKKGPVPLLVKL